MKPAIIVMFVLLLCGGTYAQQNEYKDYCNTRFSFCISYPKNLKGQGEAGNGDGQIFQSADGKVVLRAFGRLKADPADYDDGINASFKLETTDVKVVYKVIKPTWFIFSGTDKDGNTVYQKTILKKIQYLGDDGEDTWVYQTIMIAYPPALQHQYKDYCTYISKSLNQRVE